jgi:ABC-type amino acid transport system permease subunit
MCSLVVQPTLENSENRTRMILSKLYLMTISQHRFFRKAKTNYLKQLLKHNSFQCMFISYFLSSFILFFSPHFLLLNLKFLSKLSGIYLSILSNINLFLFIFMHCQCNHMSQFCTTFKIDMFKVKYF